MSLKDLIPSEIPSETVRIVKPLLDEDSVYYLVGTNVSDYVMDEQFIELYALEGRPGINPVVLSRVTIFQFLEKLPDRVAAQMARMRLDWKYALRQELDWGGFHYLDLCNFRKRLLKRTLFEGLLNHLREQGLVQAGGRQRIDARRYRVRRQTDWTVDS